MLTTIKISFIARLFFGFFFSISASQAQAQTHEIDITQNPATLTPQIAPLTSQTIKLNLTAGDYVKGHIELSQPLVRFALLSPQGQHVRELIKLEKTSSRFIFNVQQSGEYKILMQASSSQSNTEKSAVTAVEISFNQLISKSEQKITPAVPLSPTLAKLQQTLKNGGNTQAFWHKIAEQGTPLVEPLLLNTPLFDKKIVTSDSNEKADPNNSLVTFLWRGATHNVKLFGAPFGGHKALTQLADSDVWYTTYTLPNSTMLSYSLAPDIPQIPGSAREQRVAILATAQADPYNKTPWSITANNDKYNKDSALILPKANTNNWGKPSNSPKGTIKHYHFTSKILNNSREISIYTPAGFDINNFVMSNLGTSKKEHALLFVFDSKAYRTKVPTPQILDNLIAKQKIMPTIAVFVSNPTADTRAIELPGNSDFADFMAQELLPFVKRKTQSKASTDNTVLSGSSYGGLASAYIAFKYPQHFGAVLSQSGSFWWSPRDNQNNKLEDQWLTREYAKSPSKKIRFYFNAGLFETGYFSIDILESNRHFRDVLTAKGYEFTYQEGANGHDYLSWAYTLSDGLINLLAL